MPSDEIDATRDRLAEIEKAAPSAIKVWPVGNHDARFESRIANLAPEYAKVYGVHLKDHFPLWRPCWMATINGNVDVKHRIRGGMYAPRNNTLQSGRSIFTGHLHSLKVWPHSDRNGTRYGADCGTLADPYGPQFYNYTELSPLDWRSGFVMLTFKDGRMLWPEVIFVSGPGEVEFRDRRWNV